MHCLSCAYRGRSCKLLADLFQAVAHQLIKNHFALVPPEPPVLIKFQWPQDRKLELHQRTQGLCRESALANSNATQNVAYKNNNPYTNSTWSVSYTHLTLPTNREV